MSAHCHIRPHTPCIRASDHLVSNPARRFRRFDADLRFPSSGEPAQESPECISGLILQGIKKPHECSAFGVKCTPENPLGAPMVSSEGACAAYYHYGRRKERENIGPELPVAQGF